MVRRGSRYCCVFWRVFAYASPCFGLLFRPGAAASRRDHALPPLQFLLSLPHLDIGQTDDYGSTAIALAAAQGWARASEADVMRVEVGASVPHACV